MIEVKGLNCLACWRFNRCYRLPAATGARRVTAIDVGHNQIDWRLRTDARVEVRGINARYLKPDDFPKN
jgi:predicted rRNA methylase YqxC with S4 and FtsJ domains